MMLLVLLISTLSLVHSEPEDVIVQVLYRPKHCHDIAQHGDTMHVQYLGRFYKSKKKFDSSYDRNNVPFYYQLGIGGVIEGYQIGTKNMCINERRRLIVPSKFAYGTKGTGNIPGYSTLMFDVHLVQINDKPPAYEVPLELTENVISVGSKDCASPIKDGDIITIKYIGALPDGTVFDESSKDGIEFVVGAGQVIKGVDEGLKSFCNGTTVELEIPPTKAYGSRWEGPVPQWSFVYYNVTITKQIILSETSSNEEIMRCETVEKCTLDYKVKLYDYILLEYEVRNRLNKSMGEGEIRYPIGRKLFVPGWDNMLLGMCVGQVKSCWIPPNLSHSRSVAMFMLPPESGYYSTLRVKKLLLTSDDKDEIDIKNIESVAMDKIDIPIRHIEL